MSLPNVAAAGLSAAEAEVCVMLSKSFAVSFVCALVFFVAAVGVNFLVRFS